MEGELSLDNILGADEIDNLFAEDPDDISQEDDIMEPPEEQEKGSETENDKVRDTTEDVNVDELFTEDPESVGSEEKNTGTKEDTAPPKGSGTSPKNNFYSSIAKALREEGIFPDLDDDLLSKIQAPEDFRDLIEEQIKAGLDERQKRIDAALGVGVEPDEIKRYENTLNFLDSIEDNKITDESNKGEELRKNLIYQDFINRGYSKERALREVQKSFNAGTDIEDAQEALKSNKEYFTGKYNDLIDSAKESAKQQEKDRQEQADKLKDSILNDKEVFGDLSVDKFTRQKIYDNLSKPVYKDPETGQYYTAIQKYELEHRTDFLKNLGLIFTLTNGFKSFDNLVKNKVKKEVKKGLRQLEDTLNNTSRSSDGNLRYVSSVNEDPESFIERGWKLDV